MENISMRELLLRRRQLLIRGEEKGIRAVCFEADGDQTVSITKSGSAPTLTMQYSYNGRSWSDWDLSALSFGGSKKVYVRGVGNTRFASSTSAYNSFTFGTDALVYVSGIVETLLSWSRGISSYRYSCVFYKLFYGQTALCSAKNLIFSSSNITSYAYHSMFYGCTSLLDCPESLPSTLTGSNNCNSMFYNCSSLTTAPKLPATTLADRCYKDMFYNCSSLTTAPESLPATTLVGRCYEDMFHNCSSLTTAPKLPATTLAERCYFYMFEGCSSLTTAPELPATTLADTCYFGMFYGCSNLNSVRCRAKVTADRATASWLYRTASNGTFYGYSEYGWESGTNGIPRKWTFVELTD